MNWDDARVFLAIRRAGTLRGAAALLEVDQATAGRRLAALEAALGARLFLRTPNGYVPTPAGELAGTAAERMEQAANQLQRQMQGLDDKLCGVVRVATSDTMASFYVIPALRALREAHPDIRVVLGTSTQLTNLTRREADIAVRTVKPTSPDLIARRLARRQIGVYASRDYLRRRGEPAVDAALKGHDVIRYDRPLGPLDGGRLGGVSIGNARVALEVNSGMMMLEAVRAGLGLGELAVSTAQGDPELVRIWPERTERLDVWLVLHADLNRTARVRAVADAIIAAFKGED
ncbi:LysR family transcriptional regulator [Pigmentiphaga sp. NML030171]|uniref:LysR family transcriptional regulator n=1 Tax=Pigmentiphaga sp. NML030171 TaxID=2008676 RepID=UPI000B40BA1C|nr:LysR substrate-binding domain-containing protein [Pigmentiphaga sp. NML030171]OVZ58572.1 LysR family transcriptional regulator [Pigmentiphaga sp. NML030171]